MTKKIFVSIVSFNNSKNTHECIKSIINSDTKGFTLHVVVIDNASKEPFTLSENDRTSSVHVIRSDKNTGFSGGNNIGIQYALENNADYVLILNNDTLLNKSMINALFNAIGKDSTIGVVVPKIYFARGHEFHKDRYKRSETGKVLWYAGATIDWENILITHRGVDEVDKGQYDVLSETEVATGCCMLIRSEVIKKVGGFNEKYFLYFEDVELSVRIKNVGYKIVYVPSAVLWHINAGSSGGSGSTLQDYFISRNRLLFGFTYASFSTKKSLFFESIRLLRSGRVWQKKGIEDYLFQRLGKGRYDG